MKPVTVDDTRRTKVSCSLCMLLIQQHNETLEPCIMHLKKLLAHENESQRKKSRSEMIVRTFKHLHLWHTERKAKEAEALLVWVEDFYNIRTNFLSFCLLSLWLLYAELFELSDHIAVQWKYKK